MRSRPKPGVASQSQYQSADTDLPAVDDDYRTLLFASLMREGSPSILSSKFCIVAHRHKDDFDLLRETKNKPDVIEIKAGRTSVLSRGAQVIRMVQGAGDYGYKLTTKIIAWEEIQEIWISAFCDGDSPQSFQSSEAIFAGLTRIKADLRR